MLDRRTLVLLSTLITNSKDQATLKRLQIVLNESDLSADETALKLAVDTAVATEIKKPETVEDPIITSGLSTHLISPAEDLREVLFLLYATTWKARSYEVSGSGSGEIPPPIMVLAKHPYEWRRYGLWVKSCNRFERHYTERLLIHGQLPKQMLPHIESSIKKWAKTSRDPS